MAIPVGESHVYAKLVCNGAPKPCYITCGMTGSGAPGIISIVNQWKASISGAGSSPFFPANMAVDWALVETGGYQQASANQQTSYVENAVVQGTAVLETPAPNLTVNVLKRTLFAGPRFRGRFAVPPCNIGEGSVSRAGYLSGTALANQQQWWGYVFASITNAGYVLRLHHEISTAPNPSPVPPPTSISSLDVTPLVGTNRRRLR